jgi:hypothetical protein
MEKIKSMIFIPNLVARCLRCNEQAKSLELEVSKEDLHIIIQGLNTLMEKRKSKFDDELEKKEMERCRELSDELQNVASNSLAKRIF